MIIKVAQFSQGEGGGTRKISAKILLKSEIIISINDRLIKIQDLTRREARMEGWMNEEMKE